jgi:hypothetical protein
MTRLLLVIAAAVLAGVLAYRASPRHRPAGDRAVAAQPPRGPATPAAVNRAALVRTEQVLRRVNRAQQERPSVAETELPRMVLPGGEFLIMSLDLVDPGLIRLNEAGVDVLKLDPNEQAAVDGELARVAQELQELRRTRGSATRQQDGSFKFPDLGVEPARLLAEVTERLAPVLDAESASALQAVGLRELFTSPNLFGLVTLTPQPGEPEFVQALIRDGPVTFKRKYPRAAVEALYKP